MSHDLVSGKQSSELWQFIVAKVSEHLKLEFSPSQINSVSGGDINQAFCLADEKNAVFIKLNLADKLGMFDAEKKALEAIANTQTIRVPKVYFSGQFNHTSFLALEYLSLVRNGSEQVFANALAKLHRVTNNRFGWSSDNFIGSTPQFNAFSESWPEFYANYRLKPQIEMLRSKGCSSSLTKSIALLQSQIQLLFTDYQPKASLLHGDLWSGNYGFLKNAVPVIYDPASYFGDHEADLAMLELFGSPSESFWSAYQGAFPIDQGYRVRKKLYNLYHLLNHANLFGGGYFSQSESVANQLLSELN